MSDDWATALTVTEAAHAEFVALSGDSNPLHTDPLTARRLPFGRVAVHGMHLVLLALEHLASHETRTPTRLRCTFRHPVGPGDDLRLECSPTADDEVGIVVEHDVWKVADLRVELGPAGPQPPDDENIRLPEPAAPLTPSPAELASSSGSIETCADMAIVRRRFPRVERTLGERGVAELVTLTRLVGMHVPGRHSMFSAFDLTLGASGEHTDRVAFTVHRFDERFGKVVLDVDASTLRGTAVAFVRPSPVEPATGDTRPHPDDFTGQRWLVVGGSRGLGATAALLLGAGGADVRLTYRTGADDARQVAARVGATAHEFDTARPTAGVDAITADEWTPTHLAYFASPPIFDGVPGVYSHTLEARFRSIYVDAFAALLDRLDVGRLIGVLWPSSTAVDQPVAGLAEYAEVKRAGEAFCEQLRRRHPDVRVMTPRFPRLLTDQTTSFVPVDTADAAVSVLEALGPFSGRSDATGTLGPCSTP